MSEPALEARPPRRRRLGRILFVVTAPLIALALLGIRAYNVTGLNRYEAAKQRARAGGRPLTDPFDGSPLRYRIDRGCAVVEMSSPERLQERDDTSAGSQGHKRAEPLCFRLLPPEERAPASQPASAPKVSRSWTRNLDDW